MILWGFLGRVNSAPFLAFRPYQHKLGVEFAPWEIRCNGLFYPFIVDAPSRRDHHSKTVIELCAVTMKPILRKQNPNYQSCLRCEGFKSSPAPGNSAPSPASHSCVATLLLPKSLLSLPTNAQLKNTRWNSGESRRLYSSAGQGEHTAG